MKGGYVHDRIILASLDAAFRQCGAGIWRQVKCEFGYIDLVVEVRNWVLAIEAEMTARRVANDVLKAASINADELWIVAPNDRVLSAAKRALKRTKIKGNQVAPLLLTYGQALQQVTKRYPESLCEREKRKRKPPESPLA